MKAPRLSLLFVTLAAFGATPVAAQQLTFLGQVEDVSGTTNQFFVDCSKVKLTSATFNLNNFVGLQTEISGTWNGSFVNPSVDVVAIHEVPESFEVGGNGSIGREFTFGVTATPGELTVMYGAFDSGFFPVSSVGLVLLDPATLRPIASGTIPGGGNLQVKVPIPNDPSLVGLAVFGQAVIAGSGGLRLTNNDCKTIDN